VYSFFSADCIKWISERIVPCCIVTIISHVLLYFFFYCHDWPSCDSQASHVFNGLIMGLQQIVLHTNSRKLDAHQQPMLSWAVWITVIVINMLKLKLKIIYSAIKSEDSEALDGRTSQLSSQREYGEIKMLFSSYKFCLTTVLVSLFVAGCCWWWWKIKRYEYYVFSLSLTSFMVYMKSLSLWHLQAAALGILFLCLSVTFNVFVKLLNMSVW